MKKKSLLGMGATVSIALIVLLAAGTWAPAEAAEPIKVGAVLSVTGRGGFLGTPQKKAITVMVEDLNKKGGLLGRPLEVLFEDDQSDPTNAAIAATKLIRDKQVCAIIGGSLVVSCMAIMPVCEREETVQVMIAPVTIPVKKWVFSANLTDFRLSQVMLKYTSEILKAKRIALLNSSDTYGKNGAQGVTENAAKYGVSVMTTEQFEPSDTSMIPQLAKVKAAKPDAIILYANSTPAMVIAKNYQQLGMETILVGAAGIATPDFLKSAGKLLEGKPWYLFCPKDIVADELPANDPVRIIYEPLKKAMKDKYGDTEWQAMGRNGYDGLEVVIRGLQAAGTDNRAALRDALEKTKNIQGFVGVYNYSPTDHEGCDGSAFVSVIMKDGKYRLPPNK